MSAVMSITHIAHLKCPAPLQDLQGWLIWKFESNGEAKPRKVPYYAGGNRRSGPQGSATDRAQLVTFNAARAAAARRGFDGVGFALMPEFNIVALDFDYCVNEGSIAPAVEALVADTYAELSPSGKGVRAFMLGDLGNNKSQATADQFGFETFSSKGFVTLTGEVLDICKLVGNENTIAPASADVRKLCTHRFGQTPDELTAADQPPLGASLELIKEALDVLDPDMGHADWLKVGMALHHETGGEGFDLWDQWSAGGSKYPGEGNLRGRWDSFGRNPGKQVTLRSLIQLANSQGARITVNAISMEEFDALAEDVEDIAPALVSTSDDYVPITEDLAPVAVSEKAMAAASKHRFPVIPWHQFAIQTTHQYLIKGLLPKATLGVLYGESGSGKSFITLDMCVAVARGLPWRGKRSTQGRVVYIVAEGAAGFRNRLIAYARHHGLDPAGIPLDIIDATPNLLLKDDALDVCKAILDTGARPSLVVVDTLAQAMAGANENASEDMGKALAHCKGIYKATGAMVLLVHHSGKDSSRGARGWSGMRAAADVELEVTRTIQGRALRTTKQKDGADYQEWGFGLEVVNIGQDQDGDTLTSCVVVEAEVPASPGSERKPTVLEQPILNTLAEIALVQSAGIERSAVLDKVMLDYADLDAKAKKSKRKNFNTALKRMADSDDAPFAIEDDDTITMH